MRKDIQLGLIILTILISGTVMVTWPDAGLKVRIDQDKATFYILEDGHYLVKAREVSSLWDFPSKMNRDLSSIKITPEYSEADNTAEIHRFTRYIRGPEINETWSFDGKVDDITQFPTSHRVTINNGQGYVYQYEVRDLRDYNGPTQNIASPLKVGKITIEWDEGAYFAKVYKSGILKVRYKLDEPTETFNFRVYDPPATVNLYFDDGSTNHSAPVDVEYGRTVTVWGVESTGTAEVCLSADDHPGIGHNVSCDTGTTSYVWTVGAGTNAFSDASTAKNLTFASADNQSASIASIRNDSDVNNVAVGIYGYSSGGNYPKNIEIDFNNDTSVQAFHGELRGSSIEDYSFDDGSTSWTGGYTSAGVKTANILVAKDYNVTNATVDLTGEQNGYFQFNYETLNTDADGFYYRPYAPNCDIYGTSDYFYCFGGQCTDSFCSSNGGTYNTTVRFTRGGGIGSILARSPVPYKAGLGSCAIYYNNYYYIIGGYDGSSYYSTVYRYYPAGNSWSSRTSIPEAKAYHQCALHNDTGQIIISGGYTTGGTTDISAYAYNITDNTWSALTDPPQKQEQGWGEYYNSTAVIMFGGTRIGSTSGGRTYLYHINNDSWDTLDTIDDYPYANSGANNDGTIYSYGGYFNPSGYEKWAFYYNATSDTWIRTTDNLTTDFFMDDCWEIDGHVECYGSSGFGIGSNYREIYHLPDDVAIQVGNTLGTAYQGSGSLYSAGVTASNWQDEINSELQTCTEDDKGLCNITLYIGNPGAGNVVMDNLNITTDLTTISLTGANLSCATNYCNPAIRVQSDQQGILEINDINITYKGTGNVTWNASSPGDGGTITAGSTTGVATVYYSDILRTLPYTWTSTIFVLPNSYNASKWPAWGQDSNTPVVNLTGQAQDKDINISIKLNESLACLTWYYNDEDNSTSASTFTNNSYTEIDQVTTTGNTGVWMWTTLDECNASVRRYLRPTLEWVTCCDTCIACP